MDDLNNLFTKYKAQLDETRHAEKNDEHNFALQSLEDLLTTVGTGCQDPGEAQGGERDGCRFCCDVMGGRCYMVLEYDIELEYTAESPDKEKTKRFQEVTSSQSMPNDPAPLRRSLVPVKLHQ